MLRPLRDIYHYLPHISLIKTLNNLLRKYALSCNIFLYNFDQNVDHIQYMIKI